MNTDAFKPGVCIAIHDVAPATWKQCEMLLRMLESNDIHAVTLAVVPEYHGRSRADLSPWFVDAVNTWKARGGEVALHGFRHLDDGEPPRRPMEWIQRRVLTDKEGEFAALGSVEAGRRLEMGRSVLAACGWQVDGFIPPAWLASSGTHTALKDKGFVYSSDHFALHLIEDGASISAPCLTSSARSAWRRLVSRYWLKLAEKSTAKMPLLRLAMHPVDAEHLEILRAWSELTKRVVETRIALTKRQAVDAFAEAAVGAVGARP